MKPDFLPRQSPPNVGGPKNNPFAKCNCGCQVNIDALTAALTAAQEKLDYVGTMGLKFGIMKTSDRPDGFLAHIWDENSDYERMFREWTDSIGWEREVEKAKELTIHTQSLLTIAQDSAAAMRSEIEQLRGEVERLNIQLLSDVTLSDWAQEHLLEIDRLRKDLSSARREGMIKAGCIAERVCREHADPTAGFAAKKAIWKAAGVE